MRNRLAVPAALLGLLALSLAVLAIRSSGKASSDARAENGAEATGIAALAVTPPPTVQAQQSSARTLIVPQVGSDGPPATLSLSASSVFQGGALLVRANNAVQGAVTVFGRTVPMAVTGDGLVAIVGFGTEDPPGSTWLSVDLLYASGEWDYVARTVSVVRTEWTVDYIVIPPAPPPDPNEPPPPPAPPPPPDETPLLPNVYAQITPQKWTGGWAAPLPTPLRVTGYFGEQRSFNGGPVQGHHGGTDLGADAGTPIYASNDGVIVMSGLYLVRGNLVVIDHGGGVFSLYGHMSERAVEVGDAVGKGQVIGYVGSTGLSTGPHLHWELSVFGVLVDGLRWLDGSQGF